MLQYQLGEFCMIIWDGEQTSMSQALANLDGHAMDASDVTVRVKTFDLGDIREKSLKVVEEACEVRGAVQYEGESAKTVLYEICDTITACINLATSLGYSQGQIQTELDNVRANNEKRGRYDSASGK